MAGKALDQPSQPCTGNSARRIGGIGYVNGIDPKYPPNNLVPESHPHHTLDRAGNVVGHCETKTPDK